MQPIHLPFLRWNRQQIFYVFSIRHIYFQSFSHYALFIDFATKTSNYIRVASLNANGVNYCKSIIGDVRSIRRR